MMSNDISNLYPQYKNFLSWSTPISGGTKNTWVELFDIEMTNDSWSMSEYDRKFQGLFMSFFINDVNSLSDKSTSLVTLNLATSQNEVQVSCLDKLDFNYTGSDSGTIKLAWIKIAEKRFRVRLFLEIIGEYSGYKITPIAINKQYMQNLHDRAVDWRYHEYFALKRLFDETNKKETMSLDTLNQYLAGYTIQTKDNVKELLKKDFTFSDAYGTDTLNLSSNYEIVGLLLDKQKLTAITGIDKFVYQGKRIILFPWTSDSNIISISTGQINDEQIRANKIFLKDGVSIKPSKGSVVELMRFLNFWIEI